MKAKDVCTKVKENKKVAFEMNKFINILDSNNKVVGDYSLYNNTIFSLEIKKEFRRQGHARRIITELYKNGTITGPSDVLLNRYIVQLWQELGVSIEVSEEMLRVGDILMKED